MAEECRMALRSLGEASINADAYRGLLMRMGETLYGERLRLMDLLARYRSDLRAGRLEVRDRNLCYGPRCVDLYRFVSTLAEYYRWMGERTKRIGDILAFCGE